ncbi:PEF-CTERM sorting domain-containing protein [Methanolobus sp.]|nr:PEF-CTERM sorting domain-containing protein [Methanolobus sp.]
MEISCEPQEIPEFPTIALPIAAILGLAFFSSMSTVKISTKLVIICNL